MARQGVSRPKVVSSGRLTGSGRGQIHKKRFAGRCVPPLEAAYSLYSTDSEDQVTTIHKGLDRCAALLNGILQAEQAESKPKQQGTKTCTFKSKPKNLSRKIETDKKKHGKKTNTAIHVKKRAAAVQKTILSSSCHPSSAGQPSCHGDQNPVVRRAQGSQDQPSALTRLTQTEHAQQDSLPLVYSQPAASCDPQTSGQVHTSTVFNCRLTTSTPALSPQRPGSAHSEPCTSKCVLSSGGSSGEFHQSRAMSAAIPSSPYASEETSATPNQYAASFSMPPAVQRQSPFTVSPVQNGSCTSLGHSPVCSGPQVKLTSSTGSLTPNQLWVSQTQPEPNGPVQEICSEESAEDEDEKDGMDNTPVRDISCQTSCEKLTVLNHKVKPTSPEKTAQRVVTVKYLLGELKTLVANQDSDAMRLISEVEQSISLLPVMVGSTNIQAEIALAIQPLRSENVQLRRRLRILNQQLSERERAERRARPEACDMEVVTLQSLNFALQTQLNESRKELDDLRQENMRLQKAKEDKESCEFENSRLRLEMNEALAEMQSCQSKLKEYEIEKTVLSLSLQQREAEISRLQDVIRNLERSQTKDKYSPQPDVCQPNSQLTKSVLELHESAQRESTVSDQLSNSVKSYLQTLEEIGQGSPLQRVHCKSQTLQPASPGQINGGKDNFMPSDSKVYLPTNRDIHKPTLETISEKSPQSEEQKRTVFAPLKETLVQLPSGAAHGKPLTQCNELITAKNQREDVDAHVGLKHMGRAFEKLDISDGVNIQDAKNDGRDFLSDHQGVALQLIQKMKGLNNQSVQSLRARRDYFGRPSVIENTFSSCDIKSLASDWSINSWSTFNTQDELNFRDGLAALDASIESLQNTLRVDRNK
ncbi:coiled-coil domain-containing protein 14 isoform X2 [Pimephales promelas]|uniref:coiled-coil domain-containing protein 14 isoform X2 n=1 Tax=Pimephales promelas TaxID=90988 RepID=UPI00195578D0|nr:coiled-coil domain-containing protein 14 isoform X2 [Pimephales promelas]KAG1942477.1 coiled-coil domain-containing protein [Pimephales promelas]